MTLCTDGLIRYWKRNYINYKNVFTYGTSNVIDITNLRNSVSVTNIAALEEKNLSRSISAPNIPIVSEVPIDVNWYVCAELELVNQRNSYIGCTWCGDQNMQPRVLTVDREGTVTIWYIKDLYAAVRCNPIPIVMVTLVKFQHQ
jgi:hypothetical protein